MEYTATYDVTEEQDNRIRRMAQYYHTTPERVFDVIMTAGSWPEIDARLTSFEKHMEVVNNA